MGSDLYMESQNWRPRPTIVEWLDEETVKVQRDAFYTGYHTVYEGKVTSEVKVLLKGLGISLPDYKKPLLHYDDLHRIRISGPVAYEDEKMNEVWYDALEEDIRLALGRAQAILQERYPQMKVEIN